MRVTTQHLDSMMQRLTRNMRTHDLIGEGDSVVLEHGSKTNGHTFKLTTIVGGRRETPFGALSFGFTKASCYETMHALSVAMETLTYR